MGGWLDGWMDHLLGCCLTFVHHYQEMTEPRAQLIPDQTTGSLIQQSVSQSVSRAAWSLPSVFSDTNAPVRLTAWRSVGGGVMLRRAAFPPTVSRRAATLAAGCRR